MKRSLIAFGALIALLVGSLFALDPTPLLEQLVRTDLGVFALGLPAVLLSLVCWSQAFRRLLAASGGPVSSRRAFFAYGTAMFGKQVLPMGQAGGPAIMAYTFDREVSLGYNRTFAVVSVAEFLSVTASSTLAVVGVVYLLLYTSTVPGIRVLQFGVLVFASAIVLFAAVFWYRRNTVERAVAGTAELLRLSVGRLSRRLEAALAPERVDAEIDRYYETVDEVVADRRAVLVAYALTQAGLVLFTVPLYTGALALGVRLPIALVLSSCQRPVSRPWLRSRAASAGSRSSSGPSSSRSPGSNSRSWPSSSCCTGCARTGSWCSSAAPVRPTARRPSGNS